MEPRILFRGRAVSCWAGAGGSVSQGGKPGRAGSGAYPPGGAPSYGGFTGYAGTPQGPGGYYGTGATGGCCLAFPSCDPGDKQMGPGPCPPGISCYQRSACCSTITCLSLKSCGPPPTCNPGDIQIGGTCNYPCYTVSSCSGSVNCLPVYPSWDGGVFDGGGSACNPSAEYYRHYLGYSASQCAVIDYGCPINTTGFSNACGCGCEQRLGCPQWVDCMPSNGPVNPYCTDAGHALCPYTTRAL